MNSDKVKTLLLGMASINRLLAQETVGDGLFEAVTDRMSDTLIMGATALASVLRSTDDTEEFEPLLAVENGTDTREFPAVVVYEVDGTVAI